MNSEDQKFSLFQLVTSKNSVEVPGKIVFEKCININTNQIITKSYTKVVFDLSKRFNFIGNCLMKKIESELPTKRIIRIEDFVFINSQLVMTDNTGNKFGLAKEKGILELKGKVI
jgi:hypothetical protein